MASDVASPYFTIGFPKYLIFEPHVVEPYNDFLIHFGSNISVTFVLHAGNLIDGKKFVPKVSTFAEFFSRLKKVFANNKHKTVADYRFDFKRKLVRFL